MGAPTGTVTSSPRFIDPTARTDTTPQMESSATPGGGGVVPASATESVAPSHVRRPPASQQRGAAGIKMEPLGHEALERELQSLREGLRQGFARLEDSRAELRRMTDAGRPEEELAGPRWEVVKQSFLLEGKAHAILRKEGRDETPAYDRIEAKINEVIRQAPAPAPAPANGDADRIEAVVDTRQYRRPYSENFAQGKPDSLSGRALHAVLICGAHLELERQNTGDGADISASRAVCKGYIKEVLEESKEALKDAQTSLNEAAQRHGRESAEVNDAQSSVTHLAYANKLLTDALSHIDLAANIAQWKAVTKGAKTKTIAAEAVAQAILSSLDWGLARMGAEEFTRTLMKNYPADGLESEAVRIVATAFAIGGINTLTAPFKPVIQASLEVLLGAMRAVPTDPGAAHPDPLPIKFRHGEPVSVSPSIADSQLVLKEAPDEMVHEFRTQKANQVQKRKRQAITGSGTKPGAPAGNIYSNGSFSIPAGIANGFDGSRDHPARRILLPGMGGASMMIGVNTLLLNQTSDGVPTHIPKQTPTSMKQAKEEMVAAFKGQLEGYQALWDTSKSFPALNHPANKIIATMYGFALGAIVNHGMRMWAEQLAAKNNWSDREKDAWMGTSAWLVQAAILQPYFVNLFALAGSIKATLDQKRIDPEGPYPATRAVAHNIWDQIRHPFSSTALPRIGNIPEPVADGAASDQTHEGGGIKEKVKRLGRGVGSVAKGAANVVEGTYVVLEHTTMVLPVQFARETLTYAVTSVALGTMMASRALKTAGRVLTGAARTADSSQAPAPGGTGAS